MRCGNLAPARLGTASIPARTVPSTSDHSRSTASALSSEPAACAALSSARSACAFEGIPKMKLQASSAQAPFAKLWKNPRVLTDERG